MIKSEAYGKYKGYIILKTIGLKPPIYSIEDLEVAFKSPDEALRYVNSLSSRKNTNNKEIAITIFKQLGGNKFAVMTGSKNFAYDKNSLSFKIGRNKTKANYVKITLDPSDTYTVTFGQLQKFKYVVLKEYKDVYGDMLQDIFTDYTGLYTSLTNPVSDQEWIKLLKATSDIIWERTNTNIDEEILGNYIDKALEQESKTPSEIATWILKEFEKEDKETEDVEPRKNPLKPPKYWWDYMVKKIKKENPTYNKEQIAGTVGKIWWHNLTQKKRNEIIKKEWKNPYILSDIHETIFIDSSSLNYDIKTTMDKSKAKIFDTERAALQFLKTNFYGKPTAWVSTEIEEKEMESIKTIIPRVIKKIKKKSKKNIKEQWFTGEIKKVYDSPQWRKGAKTFFIKINDLEEVESILFPERFDKGLKDGMKIKYTKYLKPDGSFLINEIRKIKE